MMDRLVLSDAAWERMAPLIIGRPDQAGSTARQPDVRGRCAWIRRGSPGAICRRSLGIGERSALQKLNGPKGLPKINSIPPEKTPLRKCSPRAGSNGASESLGPRHFITPDGAKALKARIPVKEPGEKSASA